MANFGKDFPDEIGTAEIVPCLHPLVEAIPTNRQVLFRLQK
jgi:hypothetical protein